MLRATSLFAALFLVQAIFSQAPFTQKQYTWSVEKNLVYGTAINYLGLTDTLKLDLYKPQNADTARPLLVLMHGGSWLSGCKEDMAWLCTEMAARGYVVAAINYRKGWHKDDYVPAPVALDGGSCLYAADSLEIIRAIYRGAQDVKGAVRWLRARVSSDTGCNFPVVVGGESAGAFLALAAAFLDRPEEKPAACFSLPDAPQPGSNLANCYAVDCPLINHTLPPGALTRPDLGPVEGTLNLNGFDETVQGVISLYGGVPAQAFSDDWLQGPDTPALYLYHQTCDGVVPFTFGRPFAPISQYCNLGFTPWHSNYPFVYGNGSIANYLAAQPDPPVLKTDFLSCPQFNPDLALFECIRYNDNSSYHYTHNRPERAQVIADFFSPILTPLLPPAFCLVAADELGMPTNIILAPNPFQMHPVLLCKRTLNEPVLLRVLNQQGRLIWQAEQQLETGVNNLPWDENLPGGPYYLQVLGRTGVRVWRMIYLRAQP